MYQHNQIVNKILGSTCCISFSEKGITCSKRNKSPNCVFDINLSITCAYQNGNIFCTTLVILIVYNVYIYIIHWAIWTNYILDVFSSNEIIVA